MDFIINHTRREIISIGKNVDSDDVSVHVYLEFYKRRWSEADDKFEVFLMRSSTAEDFERVVDLIEVESYQISEEDRPWFILQYTGPDQLPEDYDEYAGESVSVNWSGWDTPGATCDI